MERIELSRSVPKIEFRLSAANSSLFLEKVYFKRLSEKEISIPWTDFALSVELRAKLSYTIYDDLKGCFVDERTEEILIPLVPDIYQSEPVIQLNQRIENRLFTVGVNSKQRHFNCLSMEVCNSETLSEDYVLDFIIEKKRTMSWIDNKRYSSKPPIGIRGLYLMKKENWTMAHRVECYWFEDECSCDICGKRIIERHMIDGKRAGSSEFALMCAWCHKKEGGLFGDGLGQLYTRMNSNRWLLTFGFTDDQLAEFGDDDDDDNDF